MAVPKLKLQIAENKGFDLPAGAAQVGTFAVTEAGGMMIIFDPSFVRIFSAEELEGIIAKIAEYLRVVHGQGSPQ